MHARAEKISVFRVLYRGCFVVNGDFSTSPTNNVNMAFYFYRRRGPLLHYFFPRIIDTSFIHIITHVIGCCLTNIQVANLHKN